MLGDVKMIDDKIEKLELSGKFDQAPDFELDELRDSLIGVELNNIKNRVTRFFEPANYKNSGLKMGDWITAFSEIKKMRTGIS